MPSSLYQALALLIWLVLMSVDDAWFGFLRKLSTLNILICNIVRDQWMGWCNRLKSLVMLSDKAISTMTGFIHITLPIFSSLPQMDTLVVHASIPQKLWLSLLSPQRKESHWWKISKFWRADMVDFLQDHQANNGATAVWQMAKWRGHDFQFSSPPLKERIKFEEWGEHKAILYLIVYFHNYKVSCVNWNIVTGFFTLLMLHLNPI